MSNLKSLSSSKHATIGTVDQSEGDTRSDTYAKYDSDGQPIRYSSTELTRYASAREYCPYVVGNNIRLQIKTESTDPQDWTVTATIEKVFGPFTWSCVILVRFNAQKLGFHHAVPDHDHITPDGDMRAIVKVFDRRYADGIRDYYGVCTFDPKSERRYRRFVDSGEASSFVHHLRTVYASLNKLIENDPAAAEWDVVEEEAYLHCRISDLCDTEVKAYDRLREVQGIDVPRLFAIVGVGEDRALAANPDDDLLSSRGILMEYIDGFQLSQLAFNALEDSWGPICDDAVRIVGSLYSAGICNNDVTPRNCIVRETNQTYKVFMIDLGNCTFREDGESEFLWMANKFDPDEESDMGLVLQGKTNGLWTYRPSALYQTLRNCFDSDWNKYSDWRTLCKCLEEERSPGAILETWQYRLGDFHFNWNIHKARGCSECTPYWPCKWAHEWKRAFDARFQQMGTAVED